MNKLSQCMLVFALVSVRCAEPALAQSFTPVTTQIRTPYGNVPHTYYVPSVYRYYNLGGISQKYEFTVVLTNEERPTFNAAVNLVGSVWQRQTEFCTDSIHFYSGGKYREYYCEFGKHRDGQYQVSGDTLTLVEYKISSQIPSENVKLVPAYVWKYITIAPGTIKVVYYEDLATGAKDVGADDFWEYTRVK